MNPTQKAIAATFFRLTRDKKMKLKDVPEQYRKDLSNFKRSQKKGGDENGRGNIH